MPGIASCVIAIDGIRAKPQNGAVGISVRIYRVAGDRMTVQISMSPMNPEHEDRVFYQTSPASPAAKTANPGF